MSNVSSVALPQFELFKSIVDNLPTAVFVKDSNLRMFYLNKACEKRIGLSVNDIIGKSDADLFPPDQATEFIARDRAIMASGQTDYTEEQTVDRDGVLRIWGTTKTRFDGPEGSTYLIGGQFDVTGERKRKAQYQTLTQTVPVGIWRFDDKGETHFVNDLFLTYLGVERQLLAQTDINSCFASRDRDLLGQPGQFETNLSAIGGGTRHVLAISSGFEQAPGDSHQAATVCVFDLSELKELQRINDEVSRLNRELANSIEHLKQAQDKIIRNGRMTQLGEVTATIAHELRNPLGSVRTSAFLMQRLLKDENPKLLTQLKRIDAGIIRCDAIITQLLDFARSTKPTLLAVALDPWLENLVREEVEKLPEDVECTLELTTGDREILFDPSQMSRVVINLLSNAAEAMLHATNATGKPSAKAKIHVLSRLREGCVEIVVRDNGPGISPENLKRILEPLFTTKSFGTGLGLPAVQKVLELHGGQLDVHSVMGAGASFTACWPDSAQEWAEQKVA